VEIRADYLAASELVELRSIPERAGLPCILTVRRRMDGGTFGEGEGVRLVMMAKGLAYASPDSRSNFAYVDLETDFRVPAIEEACRIFGTRIIRSIHLSKVGLIGLDAAWDAASDEPDEIPRIAVSCEGAVDLARLLSWAATLPKRDRIVEGVGGFGFPSRILAARMGSFLVYTSALEAGMPIAAPGHIDPSALVEVYRFRDLRSETSVYALTGGLSVTQSRSPELHNAAFIGCGMDAVYVPFPAADIESFLSAADTAGVLGASITVPHKESVLPFLSVATDETRKIGACNTIVRREDGWHGYNTDAIGFERDLARFLQGRDLSGLRVTLVGAGGAARAIASVLSRLGVSGLVLNRTLSKARSLARSYGFAWALNDERANEIVVDHSDLIINASTMGMEGGPQGDPLDWYEFSGREMVYDIIYKPDRTAFLRRAHDAGCRISNGWGMLRFQAAEQFRIWTGIEPPSVYFD
jgi:3-dehydroquinate dehydratase/shikimate dehydrogenase